MIDNYLEPRASINGKWGMLCFRFHHHMVVEPGAIALEAFLTVAGSKHGYAAVLLESCHENGARAGSIGSALSDHCSDGVLQAKRRCLSSTIVMEERDSLKVGFTRITSVSLNSRAYRAHPSSYCLARPSALLPLSLELLPRVVGLALPSTRTVNSPSQA